MGTKAIELCIRTCHSYGKGIVGAEEELAVLEARIASTRNETIEECADAIETPVGILDLSREPKYDGDDGPVIRRTAMAIAKHLRAMKE